MPGIAAEGVLRTAAGAGTGSAVLRSKGAVFRTDPPGHRPSEARYRRKAAAAAAGDTCVEGEHVGRPTDRGPGPAGNPLLLLLHRRRLRNNLGLTWC